MVLFGLVVDEQESLIGVIDKLDIVKAMPRLMQGEILVKEVMNSNPIKQTKIFQNQKSLKKFEESYLKDTW